MITAVRSCGCAPKYTSSPSSYLSPPCTPLSKNSAAFSPSQITAVSDCFSKISSRPNTGSRQPFENPRQKPSHDDEARCPCPRPGHRNYNSMNGRCSSCCAGVIPESKVVSKIVEGGKPYKEIEAIINDNKMVIRIQKESLESEWDPPCDCNEDNLGDGRRVGRLGGGGCGGGGGGFSGCGSNIVFQKTDNSDGCRSAKGEKSCRTLTVFPEPETIASDNREDPDSEKKEKNEKVAKPRLIELEENPNIFVLRIRKKSENSDRKNNIDLEFRTPRPWINRPKPKPELPPPKPSSPIENKMKKKSTKGKGAGKKKKGKKK